VPDNDDAGRQHAQQAAGNLVRVAANVRIVELGGLPDKGDICDWMDGGAGQSDLETLVETTPAFEPNGGANSGIRFLFKRFRDIQLSKAPAYVVDQIIPRLGVTVVWGRPKCGKTFWTFDLEMHIALGWPYRGHRVEQGEVLHIACEGVAGLGTRKEAWRLHHISGCSLSETEAIDNAPFHLCKDTALDLIKDVDTVLADIVVQFGDQPIRIITIDTLNRSLQRSQRRGHGRLCAGRDTARREVPMCRHRYPSLRA
jgi:hypothetical protein